MNTIFSNTKDAFSIKTDFELLRAYFLFKIIENSFLVKIGSSLINLALKFYIPITPFIKITVYNHFCGGISETDCNSVINKMYNKNVCSVLDFSTEAFKNETEFDKCLKKKISIIDFIKNKPEIPFAVFKPTCLGREGLFEKVSSNQKLDLNEEQEWKRVINRFNEVCNKAFQNNVKILIDAEEVSVQKAIDDLALKMMIKFNREKAIVYNTIQMYRWDRLDYMNNILNNHVGIIFGFKLVRGAYMEKEREIANRLKVKSPICVDKESTDTNFNLAIDLVFKNLDRVSLVCGSHNETSILKILDLMNEKNIDKNDDKIWFGQLYGMSDNISFNLGIKGYNVFKILPFGPVRNLIPYLIRRAEENTSVKGQTGRELQLIINERTRRKSEKN